MTEIITSRDQEIAEATKKAVVARRVYEEVSRAYGKASKVYEEAIRAYEVAGRVYTEARAAYEEARSKLRQLLTRDS